MLWVPIAWTIAAAGVLSWALAAVVAAGLRFGWIQK